MSINKKPLESVEESDLQNLLENQVPESKIIDYKEMLPGKSDSDKKEFLFDVSSFANAAGGHLVYGIKEEEGFPVEICGLHNINPDEEIRRMESIIQDGIDPRIPGISIRSIQLKYANCAIVIHIPKSWASPHMVTFKGSSKFYSRNSAGKYPLDVSEIRSAFLLSETTAERIRNFRSERLSKIVAGETPTPLNESPKSILHIIPFGAFEPGAKFDVSILEEEKYNNRYLIPNSLYNSHRYRRYNFDGLLTYEVKQNSYAQVFRNGAIEIVDTLKLNALNSFKIMDYESSLLESLREYTFIQKRLGIEPPIFIMVSLLGVDGVGIFVSDYYANEGAPIDRNALLVPEILIDNFEYEADRMMKPAFDAIWNAAGWKRSWCYNEDGKRVV
ncbi:MAG TPA: ATP-binding protein [Methanothrix sp.]|nr:ATP-binding protein [Methanothrix sp.]HPJ83369.1 ATP-binding protein [Methanothrix sp.]HPR66637.1 ATP-binding protein [Methanothrix sp.]